MSDEPDDETISGEYRVILGQDGDFDLFDLEAASPVIVMADPDEYDDETICDTIASIQPGNKLRASLVSTGEIRDTGLFTSPVYRFETVEVIAPTRSYHGFGETPVISSAQMLVTKLTNAGAGKGRATITDGEASIGRIVVFNRDHPSPAEPIFENELESLREFGDPPFHVIQTATDDGRFFIHYYFVNTETKLARKLLKPFEN